jgi:hypothetical protein
MSNHVCSVLDDATRWAVRRASDFPGKAFRVFSVGRVYGVLGPDATMPEGAKLECIAQRWDDKTVQLRYRGARSEWVRI